MRPLAVLSLSLLIFTGGRLAAAADDPLARLRPGHPRLLLTDEGLAAAEAAAKAEPLRAALHARIIAVAVETLGAPPIRHIPAGGDMLDQSRDAVQHIVTCALAYRLTGDSRFAARAKGDLLTVAAFPDWNPTHFLDVGEMSFAVGIGYDWLYPQLQPAERAAIRQALREKSLAFAAAAYAPGGGPTDPRLWWAAAMTNWNQVCNAGLLTAALALADEDPALARAVVAGVRASLPRGLAAYAPDGGYPEGPGYWTYGTTYNVIALAELESALGTDFGLGAAPGFDRTANYHLAVQGPTGRSFNYADSTDSLQNSPASAWLAERYRLPAARRSTRALLADSLQAKSISNRFFALHALWFPGEPAAGGAAAVLPLDLRFRGVADLALFRSAWDDPRAIFVGFKAGENSNHHNHLDLGSFVLDADGERWAMDLGPDNYNLPGYFDYSQPRWAYFRLNNRGHNTATPGDVLQRRGATAPIVAFGSTPGRGFAVADLTPAYPDEAASLRRGIALLDRARVLVQDEYQPLRPGTPLHWAMVTGAKISLAADGRSATLTRHGRALGVNVLAPARARLHLGSTRPPTAAEDQNEGTALLALDAIPDGAGVVRLAVLLTPLGDNGPRLPPPLLTPLAEWR